MNDKFYARVLEAISDAIRVEVLAHLIFEHALELHSDNADTYCLTGFISPCYVHFPEQTSLRFKLHFEGSIIEVHSIQNHVGLAISPHGSSLFKPNVFFEHADKELTRCFLCSSAGKSVIILNTLRFVLCHECITQWSHSGLRWISSRSPECDSIRTTMTQDLSK